jgi:hypothetical protein
MSYLISEVPWRRDPQNFNIPSKANADNDIKGPNLIIKKINYYHVMRK